jgi:hypothetical protein
MIPISNRRGLNSTRAEPHAPCRSQLCGQRAAIEGNGLIRGAAAVSVPADWLATLHHALLANHRALGLPRLTRQMRYSTK